MFAFGGPWETWGEGDAKVDTFTIVTTAASELVAPVHDRMSLIRPREAHLLWLFGEPDEAAKLVALAPAKSRSRGTSTAVSATAPCAVACRDACATAFRPAISRVPASHGDSLNSEPAHPRK